jgi:NAD(P)-dependent dehydrogenase (short-subunit alcohol dehydrogenase family)
MGQFEFDLKDKTAVITGSARGIGRSIAEAYAKAKANLVIADIDIDEAQKTASQLAKHGVTVKAIQCDVRRSENVEKMIQAAIESFSRIDILVNNAGISGASKPILHMTDKEWQNTMDINLTGIFFCSRAAARKMKKQKSGKIINILSVAAYQPIASSGDYCASKGGALMLTKVLALELAKYNIHVNAICPGMFDTNLAPVLKEAVMKNIGKLIPIGRFADVGEIQGLAVFLGSPSSDYLIGTAIPIDGGISVRGWL